jgi:hypothetical protein
VNTSDLSERELLARLRNVEDPFVERKVDGDLKDCLKTAVAFANTLPNGVPGVLFIPVKNDGTVKTGIDLDSLQRKISEKLAEAYPPLKYFQRIIEAEGTPLIAVIVPGSSERPHFGGPAFVRDGSKTIQASAEQFERLIARRQSIVEELQKWVAKTVSYMIVRSPNMVGPRIHNRYEATVIECTQWYLTLEFQDNAARKRESFALRRVLLSFDQRRSRLSVEIEA